MGESRSEALRDRGRHPRSSNTGVTVGGGRESSGSEPFLHIPELPVDIQSRRKNSW